MVHDSAEMSHRNPLSQSGHDTNISRIQIKPQGGVHANICRGTACEKTELLKAEYSLCDSKSALN
jgi:hypothetical protein